MTSYIKALSKRTLSFIMSLLMIFSSFIIFEMPSSEAAANLAFDQNNWKGWYECFLNDRSTMDSAGNLTVPTYTSVTGGYLHEQGFNPFSVSGNQIVSSLKQGNRGWDDFVAVASNGYTAPAGYSITVDIQTGKDVGAVTVDSISDSVGYGAFSIAILQSSSLSTTPFTNWLWGAGYGLCGSEGYVVTFTADANSKDYYDYYNVFKADSAGNLSNPNNASNLLEKKNLDGQIVMANGSAPVTLKLVRTAEDTYSIVLSNTNGLTQTLATGLNIDDQDQIYYGVGAFSAGLGSTSANVKPITSSAFVIQSVSDCKNSYAPANFTGNNHKVVGEELTNYYLETCSVCKATIAKRYSITYNANGGSGAPSNTAKAYSCTNPEAEATYTVSSTVPTRNGYTFAGWKATSNDPDVNGNIYQKGASIKTGYNLTLTAQWTEIGYTLTLDTAGGTMPSGYSTTYTFKADQKLVDVIGGFPVPTRTGYTFGGWKRGTSSDLWTDGWGTQPYTWGQDITITAQWTAKTYTVTFDKNASDASLSTTSKTVTYNSTYGTLPTPTRAGYTFLGWYTAASGGSKVTSSTTVSNVSAHTLYAHWQGNSYTVTLDTNGGTMTSGHSASYTAYYGDSYTDIFGSYPTAVKAGYKLVGWDAIVNGSVVYTLTSASMADQYTVESNGTFKAKWEASPYQLTIDPMGGLINGSESAITRTINYGANLNTVFAWNDILPTKAGYVFQGWKLGDVMWSDKATWDATPYNVPDDAVMNAIWEPDSFTVTFDAKGGKINGSSTYSKDIVYGSSLESTFPWDNYIPTRTGYDFTGWKTTVSQMSYTKTWNTTGKWEGNTWLIPYDVILEAQWEEKDSFTVTFNANGGNCSTASITVYYNEAYGTLPTATRTGYTFGGWFTGSSGGTQITSDTVCTATSDHTLYAHWLGQEYTLTLNLNGEHATHDGFNLSYKIRQDQLLSDVISPFPVPEMNGYTFEGWRHSASTAEFWSDGWGTQPFTWGQNSTLNAEWTPIYGIYKTTQSLNMRATPSGSGTLVTTLPSNTMLSVTQMNGKWAYCTTYYNGTLYQGWMSLVYLEYVRPDSFTLTLDPSGGNFNGSADPKRATISFNDSLSSVFSWDGIQPQRPGYVFVGWFCNPITYSSESVWNSSKYLFFTDAAMIALWTKDTFTVTLDAKGGTIKGSSSYSKDILFESALETEFPWDSHIPVRSGYLFTGWKINVSQINYTKTWNTSDKWEGNTWLIPYDATLEAQWTPKTAITVTFNANGGSSSTASKTVYNGEPYGILPTATRGDSYTFDGWFTAAEGGTEVISSTIVTATSNHSLYAHWSEAKKYSVTFNANGYFSGQNNGVSVMLEFNGTLPGGGSSKTFEIDLNQKYSDVVSKEYYAPSNNSGHHFNGWAATYTSNGVTKSFALNSENWDTAVFDADHDITFTAFYVCLHSTYPNAISTWIETNDRVIGKCRVCGYDGAYGYRVNFLARFNNAADILLSYGVPQDELFTYENCIYDPVNGIIIDFLDITNTHPKITIQFNPVVIAAQNSDAGWLGWEVDGDSTVGTRKNVEYIFDQNNNNRNKHLRFRSVYETGYYEVVFNAGSGLKGEHNDNGVLVDSNRRYGVIPIRNNEVMHDLIDYIPQAKHIGLYNYGKNEYFNPLPFENGGWHSFSSSSYTLYCSIGWSNAENFAGTSDAVKNANMMNAWNADHAPGSTTCNILNSSTCERPVSINKDIQVLPWYFSVPKTGGGGDVQDDGVAQGYLSTVYANNKGASADYSKAYFDLNERSGGTMYYKYYINSSGGVSCEPVFAFDRSDYDLRNTFIFEPSNPTECSSDFNINVYIESRNIFASYTTVISQEPKRYTYYMGEGDHYVFPKVVADPMGVPYTPADTLHTSANDDPGFDSVTDANGNTYYNSIPKNQFKLTRTSKGYPICNLYTQHATWAGFNVPGGSLPLGFPGLGYYFNGGTNSLYTPVQPHGGGQTYFVTALGYQDYGNAYGAAIPLSYPDGNNFVSFYSSLAVAGIPMQACYYTQWDFVNTFNANYPNGQSHDGVVGYPTTLPSGKTANIDSNGNHFVYGFFNSFAGTTGMTNKMFTCEDYVIDAWQLYDPKGNPVRYDKNGDGAADSYLILDTLDKYPASTSEFDALPVERRNELEVTIYNAYVFAQVPGCEFRAVWKRIYDYTLIENGINQGAENFAKVKYKDKFEVDHEDYFTETTTVRVYPDSNITVSELKAASDYVYSYLTLNVQKYPTIPGRIITNSTTYQFTITGDTTMTAQFVASSSTTKMMLDRNNQLLESVNYRLYIQYTEFRDGSNSFYATSLVPSYALYRKGSLNYTVTVSGSTASNGSYTAKYDEVITLMTNASGFVGWKSGGIFIGYDPIFDYRVTGTVSVEAVYSGTAGPNIAITSSASNADSRETFTANYAAPKGYTLVESGFLVSETDQDFSPDSIGDCVESSNYAKIVSANRLKEGTFKMLVPSGTHYVAAYAIYYDKSNNIVKCISDTITQ